MFKVKEYVKVQTLQEAYDLNQKRSNIIVGGMMWLKMANYTKMTAVDLSGLLLDGIEETAEEFRIGCMCTLRRLELHEGLNHYFDGMFKECTRHIVGVQFRNGATVGGSIFGRYGFSDLLTGMMVLDTWVELYQGGLMPLSEFNQLPRNRDILVRIIIKKDGRKAGYMSQRRSAVDFPIIACGLARKDDCWYLAAGARPSRAALTILNAGKPAKETAALAAEAFTYGSNFRAGNEYRKHLAAVCFCRLMECMDREGE